MLEIAFLSATKPIQKKYELDALNNIKKHNYPFVYEVTSIVEQHTDLQSLTASMQKYAATGMCILKGIPNRPLNSESRAGSTDAGEKTKWVCLDLDGIENYQSVDAFLEDIGCKDVSYILQWSSSMGIENKSGFRCHIFMELDTEQHPQILKHWLMDLNLSIPTLNSQLELTKTNNALRWPLDITTCQNDKLLYIAPPALGTGIKDPFPGKQRISYIQKKHQTLKIKRVIPTRDALRQLSDTKIAELREKNNLPKRKTSKFKYSGVTEYLVSPDSATITESKTERGFVYFNLNGGDSWAYYHPEDNAKFIYNFKGEPVYRTEDLLPEYWAKIKQNSVNFVAGSNGVTYLAFRDFKSSNYYNGTYDAATDTLELAMAKSESQLRSFMGQHGQPIGDFIPDWYMVWDPHNKNIIEQTKREINTYQPSPIIQLGYKPNTTSIPPTIAKVLSHVLGGDAPTINHFINWLAVIVQTLDKTGTAWVWQGTQGTGKGVLFHSIISPILGEYNVVSKRMEELESEFTGFMENKFVVFIDEIESGKSLYHNKITAKLKNLIVEPVISIRSMYRLPYMAKNYSNMIFASNKAASVEVAPDDRRFNVGPYQTVPLRITAHEVDVLIPAELHDFYSFLMCFKADQNLARTPLQSAARDVLIDISQTAVDQVSAALLKGDLEFLWDHLPTDAGQEQNMLVIHKLNQYKALLIDLVTNLEPKITREELFVIYDWCVGQMPQSPHKFTALLKHHSIHMSQVWKHNRNARGIDVTWNVDPVWLASARQEIASGAI